MKVRSCLSLTILIVTMGIACQALGEQPAFQAEALFQQKQQALKYCDDKIEEIRRESGRWKLMASVEEALLVTIFILGATIAVIEGFERERAKQTAIANQKSQTKQNPSATREARAKFIARGQFVVMILGATSSILTICSVLLFSMDFRQLYTEAANAEQIINETGGLLDKEEIVRNVMTAEDLGQARADFCGKYNEYTEIYDRVNGTHSHPTISSNVLEVVYAQESKVLPGWVEKLPSDSRFLYFVGQSTNSSLTIAAQNSESEARNKLREAFGIVEPYVPVPGRENLTQAAKVKETFQAYDKASAKYTYYTLLSIDGSLQPKPEPKPERPGESELRKKGWSPVDLAYDPVAGLFVMDHSGGVSKVTVDHRGVHLQLLFTVEGAPPFAIAVSHRSVFVGSNASEKFCHVSEYSVANGGLIRSEQPVAGSGICRGITTDGEAVYLMIRRDDQIGYWPHWGFPSYRTWGLPLQDYRPPQTRERSPLNFDALGSRLVYAEESGKAYSISIPVGKSTPLALDVGDVNSIATSLNHILFASQKKVLFCARSDNHKESPPEELNNALKKEPWNGAITGVAVDASDAMWITDDSSIKGPFPLN